MSSAEEIKMASGWAYGSATVVLVSFSLSSGVFHECLSFYELLFAVLHGTAKLREAYRSF